MKNIIYGLKDPRNDVYQYIGKSTVGDIRALKHLTKSHSKKVNEWLNDLNNNWLYPIIEIIEEVQNINDLLQRERFYINYYYQINPNLLNINSIDKNINNIRTKEDENSFNNLIILINKIPELLKKERICRRLTQQEISKKMGVSRSTVSLCENGKNVTLGSIQKYLLTLKEFDLISNQLTKRVSHRAHNNKKTLL